MNAEEHACMLLEAEHHNRSSSNPRRLLLAFREERDLMQTIDVLVRDYPVPGSHLETKAGFDLLDEFVPLPTDVINIIVDYADVSYSHAVARRYSDCSLLVAADEKRATAWSIGPAQAIRIWKDGDDTDFFKSARKWSDRSYGTQRPNRGVCPGRLAVCTLGEFREKRQSLSELAWPRLMVEGKVSDDIKDADWVVTEQQPRQPYHIDAFFYPDDEERHHVVISRKQHRPEITQVVCVPNATTQLCMHRGVDEDKRGLSQDQMDVFDDHWLPTELSVERTDEYACACLGMWHDYECKTYSATPPAPVVFVPVPVAPVTRTIVRAEGKTRIEACRDILRREHLLRQGVAGIVVIWVISHWRQQEMATRVLAEENITGRALFRKDSDRLRYFDQPRQERVCIMSSFKSDDAWIARMIAYLTGRGQTVCYYEFVV